MSLFRRFGGFVSLKLLSSPSESRIGRSHLRAITMLCAIAVMLSSVFGIIQWTLAHKMSASLDHVVSGSLTALAISQQLTSAMGDAHRFTLSTALANNESEKRYSASNRLLAFQTYLTLLTQLQSVHPEEVASMLQDCTSYREKSDTLCIMLENGDVYGALAFRTSDLRPMFEKWQQDQTQFGNSLLVQARQERLSAQAAFHQTNMFLLCAIFLPVIVGAACLIGVISLLLMPLKDSSPSISRDAWEH